MHLRHLQLHHAPQAPPAARCTSTPTSTMWVKAIRSRMCLFNANAANEDERVACTACRRVPHVRARVYSVIAIHVVSAVAGVREVGGACGAHCAGAPPPPAPVPPAGAPRAAAAFSAAARAHVPLLPQLQPHGTQGGDPRPHHREIQGASEGAGRSEMPAPVDPECEKKPRARKQALNTHPPCNPNPFPPSPPLSLSPLSLSLPPSFSSLPSLPGP